MKDLPKRLTLVDLTDAQGNPVLAVVDSENIQNVLWHVNLHCPDALDITHGLLKRYNALGEEPIEPDVILLDPEDDAELSSVISLEPAPEYEYASLMAGDIPGLGSYLDTVEPTPFNRTHLLLFALAAIGIVAAIAFLRLPVRV